MPLDDNQLSASEIGVETEDDASELSLEEIQNSYVTGSDWTTETIVGQLRKGNIDLNPRFQRREVWDRTRKSKLIESIILNLPIPQIVLAERKEQKNTYIVLDGKQRLLTIRQFCADPNSSRDKGFHTLKLTKLTILERLNGETYTTLRSNGGNGAVLTAFDNSTIRTVVIRNWPDNDFLFRVFRRLNTGSVPLSPQELRQALIPGPFTDFLDEFTGQSKALQRALGNTKPDFRMRDNEIFLRYMAFATGANRYGGNLKEFLDNATKDLNSRWRDDETGIRREAYRCNQAISATQDIFGFPHSFCTYNSEEATFSRRFNRAVFDIMTFYFRDSVVRKASKDCGDAVKNAFIELSRTSIAFHQSLTTTTKSKKATATRFVEWADTLSTVIEERVEPPSAFVDILQP